VSDRFHFLANRRHFQSVKLQNKVQIANTNLFRKVRKQREENISSPTCIKVKLTCRALSLAALQN